MVNVTKLCCSLRVRAVIALGLAFATGLSSAATNTPPFQPKLPNESLWPQGRYVKSFSSRWRNPTNYAPTLALPALPAWFGNEVLLKSRAATGRNLFSSACAACHGANGNGREATAKDLEDSWGEPAPVTDLRQPALRNGKTLESVYRVLLTGIDGTPMPSFAETLTEEQRWEILAFISRLRGDPSPGDRR